MYKYRYCKFFVVKTHGKKQADFIHKILKGLKKMKLVKEYYPVYLMEDIEDTDKVWLPIQYEFALG